MKTEQVPNTGYSLRVSFRYRTDLDYRPDRVHRIELDELGAKAKKTRYTWRLQDNRFRHHYLFVYEPGSYDLTVAVAVLHRIAAALPPNVQISFELKASGN